MSALQVEKHPITTPGPFSTPPLARNIHLPGNYTPMQMTPPLSIRGTPPLGLRSNVATPPMTIRGSIGTPPLGIRGSPPTRGSSPVPRPGSSGSSYYGSPRFGDYKQSPRPHSSPKMKLRFLMFDVSDLYCLYLHNFLYFFVNLLICLATRSRYFHSSCPILFVLGENVAL